LEEHGSTVHVHVEVIFYKLNWYMMLSLMAEVIWECIYSVYRQTRIIITPVFTYCVCI